MKAFSRFAACTLLTVSTLAGAEEPTAEARKDFRNGLTLVHNGEFEKAADAFEQAYRARPNFAVLYNLGQARLALGRHADAVRAFERFLAEGGERIEAKRRHEVETIVGRERASLGRLEFEVLPGGAEVFVDGRRLGDAPVAVQEFDAGQHVVVARSPEGVTRMVVVELAAGTSEHVALDLSSAATDETRPASATTFDPPRLERASPKAFETCAVHAPPRPPSAPPPLPLVDGSRRGWALGLGVGGLVLAGAAVATFTWNSGRYAQWRRDRDGFDSELALGEAGPQPWVRSGRLSSRAADLQRIDDLTVGLALGAGSALVTAAVLWLTRPAPKASTSR